MVRHLVSAIAALTLLVLLTLPVSAQQVYPPQSYSGRAFGVSASGPLLGLEPTPEVILPSQGGSDSDRVDSINQPPQTTDFIFVQTIGGGLESTSNARVQQLQIGDPQLGELVSADTIYAASVSECTFEDTEVASSRGLTSISGLMILGESVAITGEPNQTVTRAIPGGTLTVIVDRRIGGDGDLTVQGLYVLVEVGGQTQDYIVASAKSDIVCTQLVTKTFELTLYGTPPGDTAFSVVTIIQGGDEAGTARGEHFCGPGREAGTCEGGGTTYSTDSEFLRDTTIRYFVDGLKCDSTGQCTPYTLAVEGTETITGDMTNTAWYDFDTDTGGQGDGPPPTVPTPVEPTPVEPTPVDPTVVEPTEVPVPQPTEGTPVEGGTDEQDDTQQDDRQDDKSAGNVQDDQQDNGTGDMQDDQQETGSGDTPNDQQSYEGDGDTQASQPGDTGAADDQQEVPEALPRTGAGGIASGTLFLAAMSTVPPLIVALGYGALRRSKWGSGSEVE